MRPHRMKVISNLSVHFSREQDYNFESCQVLKRDVTKVIIHVIIKSCERNNDNSKGETADFRDCQSMKNPKKSRKSQKNPKIHQQFPLVNEGISS